MHVFIVLVEFSGISLRCESCQTFFIDIYSQWLIASDYDINSQIKLVAINQQRIGNVSGYDTQLINVQIVDVVNDMDSTASTRITWLHDPNVSSWVTLLQFLVMR